MGEDDTPVSEERREELLERIQRGGATVGQQIPSAVEVAGTEMNLREFVWETKKQGAVPPELHDRVRIVRGNLQEERRQRKDRLETAPLATGEAERLAQEIVGIDRALAALQNLRKHDFGTESKEGAIENDRRWVKFLDTILE